MKCSHCPPGSLQPALRAWQGARTDAQAAAALGVNRRTYENWKAGRNAPRGLAIEALQAKIKTGKRP